MGADNSTNQQLVHLETLSMISKKMVYTFFQLCDNCITEPLWEAIFSILVQLNAAGPAHEDLCMITSKHRVIMMEKMWAFIMTFIGNSNQDSQNSYMAYTCLTSSIAEEGFAKINLNQSQFIVNKVRCCPLLLKMK